LINEILLTLLLTYLFKEAFCFERHFLLYGVKIPTYYNAALSKGKIILSKGKNL